MSQIMQCPHCNGQMTITPDLHGLEVTCPHCRRRMSIPGVPQAPAEPQYSSYGDRQYQQPGYGPAQRGYGQAPVHVPDYLVPSILLTIFCSQICGLIAIIYSVMSNSKKASGDYRGALNDANTAKTCLIVGVVINVILIPIFLFFFLGAGFLVH